MNKNQRCVVGILMIGTLGHALPTHQSGGEITAAGVESVQQVREQAPWYTRAHADGELPVYPSYLHRTYAQQTSGTVTRSLFM
jgi:hypothetical protein